MSQPYEVSVSVPGDPQLTAAEKAALKADFKASVVEVLDARGLSGTEVYVEIVMPASGGSSSSKAG